MPEPSLHHIGYVVSSIDQSLGGWLISLGGVAVSEVIHDPIQRVRVVFISLRPAGTAQFELVEPAAGDSPVSGFAAKGGGLHHLCFEVDHLDRYIAYMKGLKATLVRAPQPATAFEGRRIAWMYLREKLLVEYLERP